MAVVIITEKPSVAADIANVLNVKSKKDTHWESDEIIVTWAVGHLLDLKMPEDYDKEMKDWRKSIDKLPFIPSTFELKAKNNTKKQLSAVNKLIKAKTCTEIVNSCDAAREGELIFRRIIINANVKVPMSRMWLQSMTNEAIKDAWENRTPSEQYDSLSDAAISRAEADWIIGINGTRIANNSLKISRKSPTLSIGRVQTPTLAIIVDHELSILSYSPKPFWKLEAKFTCEGAEWTARWERKGHKDDKNNPESKAHRIVEATEKQRLEEMLASPDKVVVTQNNRASKSTPPLPFDLTSLQKEANKMWSWSATRTDKSAQSLYLQKLTTYPRTDSRHLPEDMKEEIATTVRKLGAQDTYNDFSEYLVSNGLRNTKRNFDNGKIGDHYAIIPTGKLPAGSLSNDEDKLYDLIVRQFIASFYPEAEWIREKRIAVKCGEEFVKEVSKLSTPGWRAVRPKSEKIPEGWGALPSNPCEDVEIAEHEFAEEKSKPPNRLKEAGLLSLMENAGKYIDDEEISEMMKGKGLGTPATRAETIQKLVDKNMISRTKGGSLRALPNGIRLIDMLRRIPVQWITSPELTGEMESKLADVQKGKIGREVYMNDITKITTELIEKVKSHDRKVLYSNDKSVGLCPICGANVNETILSYMCCENGGKDSGCSFVMWKDSSGRWFDRETVSMILEEKSIQDLHGFFTMNGEGYSNNVSITDDGIFAVDGQSGDTSGENDEELCECPKCERGTIRIGEKSYACDNGECTFRGLGRNICKRDISVDEAKKILTEGKSELIEDFVSKRGKNFPAFLVLEDKKVGFEFPPRAPPADAKKFTIEPGVVGMCPKHNVGIIETETHYQAEQNSEGCKISMLREISKRTITRDEAKNLIENRKIGPFDDFTSKGGKPFSATLYLKGNESIGYRFAKK